ncbi:Heat shock protein [Thalictrum thalictroides]|uniref:Heat shock protein n=1 Tax=Thalictrum thalictroides TaxID=46969 RepID=A0A7J6V4U3_THATH|nr:Heat shock protein [Thalictrum thalictroides]
MSDSLSSDDDDDDDDEGEDQDSDDEYDDRSLDVVRKFMKYVDQLVDQKRDVKSLGKVEDSDDDDEPSVELVRQYMKYMDKLMQKRDGEKSGNYIKEDDEAVYVRTEMPGLSKEDVKVTVEKNLLVVKGKERKEAGDDEKGMNYNGKFKLETELYKIDKIKAEMKNGVLMVVVPKLKEEERKDIIQVKVD